MRQQWLSLAKGTHYSHGYITQTCVAQLASSVIHFNDSDSCATRRAQGKVGCFKVFKRRFERAFIENANRLEGGIGSERPVSEPIRHQHANTISAPLHVPCIAALDLARRRNTDR